MVKNHQSDNTVGTPRHPFFGKNTKIGKLNAFLLILVIGVTLVLAVQNSKSFRESSEQMEEKSIVKTKSIEEAVDQDISTSFELASNKKSQPVEFGQTTDPSKFARKQIKKIVSNNPLIPSTLIEPSAGITKTEPANEVSEIKAENEIEEKISKKILTFNLWSVAELRLRAAYTKLMNDGSKTAKQLQEFKNEYLTFVNKRTKNCGQLDDRFASNINTVEKLIFDEKSLKTLDCHTSENIVELSRLSDLGFDS